MNRKLLRLMKKEGEKARISNFVGMFNQVCNERFSIRFMYAWRILTKRGIGARR